MTDLPPVHDRSKWKKRPAPWELVTELRIADMARDAGYWHSEQMANVVNRGIVVLIPPDALSHPRMISTRRTAPT